MTLRRCAKRGNVQLGELLIKYNADVNAQDASGVTPLSDVRVWCTFRKRRSQTVIRRQHSVTTNSVSSSSATVLTWI
jgi:hypothetical protein